MDDPATTTLAVRGCNVLFKRAGVGRSMLVLHGVPDAGVWFPYLRMLAGEFDLIAPQHPGFGQSDTPDWLETIHDLADYYLDFLDALDLDRIHLVGVSLGGWIAAELAAGNTTRLASLTLAGATGLYVEGVAGLDPFLRTEERPIGDLFVDPGRAREMAQLLAPPELAETAKKNRFVAAKLTRQSRDHDPDFAKRLHHIDVPTLLLWGAQDRLVPKEHAEAWRRLIPRAQTAIIPECGLLPHLEKPKEFVSLLTGFIMGERLEA
jgi:pimeloyl-ACP methyl ester carboxylesterase